MSTSGVLRIVVLGYAYTTRRCLRDFSDEVSESE